MKYFLLLLLLFAGAAHAQLTDKQMKEMHDNMLKIDSSTAQLNESIKASQKAIDSINMARFNEQNNRNLDAFMAERREQEKKQLKAMYLRLAFGGLMLIVLIVGFLRKKKKKV